MKKLVLALLIAAGSLGIASTAEAGRYYYGPRNYGYYGRSYYRPYYGAYRPYGYYGPRYYGSYYYPTYGYSYPYYGSYYAPYGYPGGGVTYYGPNVGVTVGW